ncbi:nucleotidyltransferase domain-containing protein [Acinetobacter bereziniae]|uniref:nucleotidyltransferase domain-containing protein n=1 Tax=Acinetobacter bereziniae TaxID=106648 RepID=UPI00124FC5F2|nr:nucleotidyltransferase domain-containing protein [Acinetobacter bereziniae]MDA3442098.1 nucleotidyltransferase domain-containing protein [Acinetobacter bereziniae]
MIQSEFEPVLMQVINVFCTEFPTELHSVYVYGSVAKGTAVIGQSDLDLCVVFVQPVDDVERKISQIKSDIMALTSFFSKVDVDIGVLQDVLNENNRKSWGAWIKFFCHPLYGDNLSRQFENVEIDRSVILAINQGYDQEIQHYFEMLATTRLDLQDSVNLKKSVLKRIIRLLPLTWLEIEQWPVNLENTVLQALQKYPEQKPMFEYLLKELENPDVLSRDFLDQVQEIYLWVCRHIK